MKLEHLAPYLPYNLQARIEDFKCDYVGREFDLIIGIHQWDRSGKLWSVLTEGGAKPSLDKIKPILRPLSDLTKEIEHNGEKFVPMKKLKTGGTNKDSVYTVDDWNGTNYVCCDNENHELRFAEKTGFDRRYNSESRQIYAYDLFQKLFEWHFDVFGLIEKGEAIDINIFKK